MDSTHTILSHLFIICLSPPPTPLPTNQRHPTPKTSARRHTHQGFCSVNNKSCVTLQITQTASHLFIVLYHNNYLVRTKATGRQTQAFVNELGRLPDLKINCQCCSFRPTHACIPASPLLTPEKPQRKNRDCDIVLRENRLLSSSILGSLGLYTGV